MSIEKAVKHFKNLLKEELTRVERMKIANDWIDYSKLNPLIIGIIEGDGIGPIIAKQANRILGVLFRKEMKEGTVQLQVIEGLTIENRVKEMRTIPEEVLIQIKKCHVILKGPTTTPKEGDSWPNIESANVALRRELDLFANVRLIKIPEQGINWIFFRENTEGAYVLGSKGINVTSDLAIDFTVTTTQGSERIIRLAFEYAKKNNIKRVTVVTKANIVKTTDGKFLHIARQVAREYPEIEWDDWFVDIISAKLIDPKRRTQFKVFVLPNLYGDIITDEAAELQGGVGTAGSANIGIQYAIFEVVHGSAPRMVEDRRTQYADPLGILHATVMLLKHIGFEEHATRLEMALDICGLYEKKKIITGRSDGVTSMDFTDYVLDTIRDQNLNSKWQSYQKS